MSLKGQTALVTGGGTGIGLGIALALADAGCRVAIVGRRLEPLQAAAAAYQGKPPLIFQTADVGDPASVERLIAWAAKELGPLDILVNSAGVNIIRRKMAELSIEDWDKLMQINAHGAYYCMRAVLPQMRERRSGLIVNISSIAGKRASTLGGVAYSASKFAMAALGMTAALEEGMNGIRITNVYPGEVDTPILEMRPEPVSAEHRARILQPSDVGAAVVMVAELPPRAHVPELIIKPTSQAYA